MLSVAGLFLSGVFKKLWAWLQHRSFWQFVCIALAIVCVLLVFQRNEARSEAAKWQHQYTVEHQGRVTDRATYVAAQQAARIKNQQQIDRAVKQQEDNSHAQVSTLNGRLELIRSELRKEQSAAPQNNIGGSQAGPGVEGPCRVIDPAWMCLSPADRLRAAENEERHDELIDLVIKQSQVDPNK